MRSLWGARILALAALLAGAAGAVAAVLDRADKLRPQPCGGRLDSVVRSWEDASEGDRERGARDLVSCRTLVGLAASDVLDALGRPESGSTVAKRLASRRGTRWTYSLRSGGILTEGSELEVRVRRGRVTSAGIRAVSSS